MRSFTGLDALIGSVPAGIVTRLSVVDAGRGSEALYADQLPGLLKELADVARVESVIASSAIEGIVVEQARAERLSEAPTSDSASATRRSWPGTATPSTTCFRAIRAISPWGSCSTSTDSCLTGRVVKGGSSRPSTTSS